MQTEMASQINGHIMEVNFLIGTTHTHKREFCTVSPQTQYLVCYSQYEILQISLDPLFRRKPPTHDPTIAGRLPRTPAP